MREIRPVVTVIIRKEERILILKRSNRVSSYQGKWSGVSGSISKDETAAKAAIRELQEEIGIKAKEKDLVALDDPIRVEDKEIIWEVHPFLLDIEDKTISLDWEHEKCEWIAPSDIREFNVVPKLDEVVESLLSADKIRKTKKQEANQP